MDYAAEKAVQAIETLAAGHASLRERLFFAIEILTRLQERHVPDADLWNRLQEIVAQATAREPVGDEGRIQATLGQMPDGDATQLAEQIVSWGLDVDHAYRVEEE